MKEYNQKRNFDKTSEPPGKTLAENSEAAGPRRRRYVVQRHFASREHYDFRLEWDGALKSWAVPKGPSLNPADKRLAVQVEDHPLEYRHFEGTIPAGQYGAGTVSIWDEGTYEPLTDMEEGLRKGSLKFTLHGKRLTGGWALARMKEEDPKKANWLLIKEKSNEGGSQNPFDRADAQLAKLVKAVPSEGGWLYELKYDGYRILSFVEEGGARLLTRNGGDYEHKFKAAAQALAEFAGGRSMVLDGEMVVADSEGRPDFQALQSYIKNPAGKRLQYMVFDLLALDGADLRPLPLRQRKEMLAALLAGVPEPLHYSVHIEGQGEALLQAARNANLEGIVGKRAESAYTGTRNGDWVKIKCAARQEFVVGGYTVSSKRAQGGISSLLLGVYRDGRLVYCGRAGGFSQQDMAELGARFKSIMRKTPPFQGTPKARAGEEIMWLKPQYAAEIAFAEWTREGLLRQAKFKGLRTDKDVREIKREEEDELDECVIEGVKITHPDKVVSGEVAKRDLALYYQKVAPRMLPYVRGRFLSAIRCPGGMGGECFFKKHPEGDKESYYAIGDAAGLLTEVQMNTLEFHVWGSLAAQPERPDVMVFDLDPDEGMGLEDIRQGVRDLKGILDELGLKSYLKTSGGKGYHVVVPFRPAADWEAFRDFARGVVRIMEEKWPERYTGNVRKASRKGRIFVDWIRNTRGATSVAPYSVRNRVGLPVSMPIAWGELDKIAPGGIDMAQALKRLGRKDPWEGFLNPSPSIPRSPASAPGNRTRSGSGAG